MSLGTSPQLATTAEQLQLALAQMESARRYLLSLLDGLSDEQWFWTPPSPTTHIAWQVGHLAVAQYGLMLFRQRGRLETDAQLMSGEFRKLFMKGTNPLAERANYPTVEEIRTTLSAVHRQAMAEGSRFEPAELSTATEPPHFGPANRLGSLLCASHHEMVHAGQVGLLRRMQGLAPVR